MRVRRAAAAIAVLLTAALAGVGGLAWACTSQVTVLGLSSHAGAAGSAVAVNGAGVANGSGQVEIRWNSVHGPRLASATADGWGNFSATVTIPDVPADVYSLVIVDQGFGVGRAAFEVTAPASGSNSAAVATPAGDIGSPWPQGAGKPEPGGDSNVGMTLGVGLLGVGLVALFSGFAVAAGRRRRSLSGPVS